MRKFLTTLFTASALALPAAAAIPDGPGGESPRDQRHARAERGQQEDRGARANDGNGARSDARPGRNRPEAPQISTPAPATPAASGGPAEWSRHGRADGPRHRDGGDTATRTAPSAPASSTWQHRGDAPRDGDAANRRHDRPSGSFGNQVGHRDTHAQWNRNWRQDRSYDWRNYRERNRTLYRAGRYYDPYGTQYRRWMIGWSIRPSYYRSSFWISDPWQYRLPEVYGPYRWVRYYDDAVLVNTFSGEVVDVIYNFFW